MKKYACIILCILFAVLLPATNNVKAENDLDVSDSKNIEASGKCNETVFWELKNGILTIWGTGKITPNRSEQVGFVRIYYYPWTVYADNITEIVIKEGITSIGKDAFRGYHNVKKVSLPDGLTEIGYDSFCWCDGLEKIELPSSLTTLESGSFSVCKKLTSVTIPGGITVLGGSIFSGCSNLENVIISDGIDTVSCSMFRRCSKLINT